MRNQHTNHIIFITSLFFCLGLLIHTQPSFAHEKFGSGFQSQWAKATPDTLLTALAFFETAFDAKTEGQSASEAGYDLAIRHQRVVTGLMEDAFDAQIEVLPFLKSSSKDTTIGIRPLWIVNAIEITAPKNIFLELANFSEVAAFRAVPTVELITPISQEKSDIEEPIGIPYGIIDSKAPSLWALGITGKSSLVCNVDTGVDGSHRALAASWRGLDSQIEVEAAWYDPITSSDFPFDAKMHGTHTMGTIVGDDRFGNRIGMAPQAQWIAASVIDRVGLERNYTDALLAFQWAIDPDGDPTTTDDVPDVINNSWGVYNPDEHSWEPCDNYLWQAIDNIEAAGTVMLFAAGNEGEDGPRIPANRISSSINAFSVGAIMEDGATVTDFSSLGPSQCDNATIKPEVVAVGHRVISSIPNDYYGYMNGTSMATPHVAGAVALMRDAVPNSTPQQIKMALYMTAIDLGPTGEDNSYGRGKIDVVAALNYLVGDSVCDYDGDGHLKAGCGGDDCNDFSNICYPGADEICDGLDNNCDGVLPDDEADFDADRQLACQGDCNDQDPYSRSDMEEICDGQDNNCDGALMEGETDPDNDGYYACADDCGPNDPDVHPGVKEKCNGIDDNCDGVLPNDEQDLDGDGYFLCNDCDDTDREIHPDAVEICNNNVDDNCNGQIDGADPDCSEGNGEIEDMEESDSNGSGCGC